MTGPYRYLAIALAALLAVAAAWIAIGHYGSAEYAAGHTAGRNEVLVDDAHATDQLRQQHDQLEQFSAYATGAMNRYLGDHLPAIEAQSHASQESIRVIYRDRPVPADRCSRPAGVQAELDQAVDAANAAAATHIQL